MSKLTVSVVVAALSLALVACSDDKSGGATPAFAAEDSASNLEALFVEIQKAIDSGDTTRAAGLTRGLLPTKASLGKALKDEAVGDLGTELLEMFDKMTPKDNAKLATLFKAKPGRTELQVHGATTEEIASGAPSAVEFPGGAKRLAETVLRPGVKFYEVEQLEPGKSTGTKFHLFFFDGKRWVMMGPAWRVNR